MWLAEGLGPGSWNSSERGTLREGVKGHGSFITDANEDL